MTTHYGNRDQKISTVGMFFHSFFRIYSPCSNHLHPRFKFICQSTVAVLVSRPGLRGDPEPPWRVNFPVLRARGRSHGRTA
jgi:hypothetical protein